MVKSELIYFSIGILFHSCTTNVNVNVQAFSNIARETSISSRNRMQYFTSQTTDRYTYSLFEKYGYYSCSSCLRMVQPDENELAEQKQECVASLASFNDGTWLGVSVSSFSLTSDVAAGPINRIDFTAKDDSTFLYKTHVRTVIDANGLKMQETFEWSESESMSLDGSIDKESSDCVKVKSVRLGESADVDSVDGSYSVDVPLLDLPSIISGTKTIIKFGIEHSLAISDDERTKCFLLYGMDDRLIRIIIANEVKVQDFDENIQNINDINDMVNSIVDKMDLNENTKMKLSQTNKLQKNELSCSLERFSELQAVMAKSNSAADENTKIVRCSISIFALIGGVWLGDVVNREHSKVNERKGFGNVQPKSSEFSSKRSSGMSDRFAEWATGVQKVAMSFQWDYGKVIRQKNSFGNAMGVPVSNAIPNYFTGEIILNEMLSSRRKDKSNDKPINERMIYMDFDSGTYVACIVGSTFIKAPRLLSFSFKTGKMQSFHTDLAVFQKRESNEFSQNLDINRSAKPSELFCSRMTRLYGGDGRLLQASSSFFTLDRLMKEN